MKARCLLLRGVVPQYLQTLRTIPTKHIHTAICSIATDYLTIAIFKVGNCIAAAICSIYLYADYFVFTHLLLLAILK